MDYYSILGIQRNASQDDVRKAYKKQSMKHHPDRGGDEEEFKKINEAYQNLSDPQKRAAYDNPQPQYRFDTSGMGGGFEDVFASMFGGRGFNPRQRQPVKNPDITVQTSISMKEVYTGKKLYVTYVLQSGQNERVEINIPRGINDGQIIRYSGLGDDSIKDLPRGDLYVKIRISSVRGWIREGFDLHTSVTTNVFDFITGSEIELNTLDERTLSLKIPKGTTPGTTFSIHGYGIPDIKRGRKGVLYVKVNATVPKITDEKLLRKIEKIKNAIT